MPDEQKEESNAEREARLLKAQQDLLEAENPDAKSELEKKQEKEEEEKLKNLKEEEKDEEETEEGKEKQKDEDTVLEAEALKEIEEEEKAAKTAKSKEAEELEALRKRYAESSAEGQRLNAKLQEVNKKLEELEKKRKEDATKGNPLINYSDEILLSHLTNEESRDWWPKIHAELNRRREMSAEEKLAKTTQDEGIEQTKLLHRNQYLELSKIHPDLMKPESDLYKEAGRIYMKMGAANHPENMTEAIKLGCASLGIPFNLSEKDAKKAEIKDRLRKIRAAEEAKRKRLSGRGGDEDKDDKADLDVEALANMSQEDLDRLKDKNPKKYKQILAKAHG